MGWGRFFFTKRNDTWHISGPLAPMLEAARLGTPIRVTKRDGDCWVRLAAGSVTAERRGGAGITAQFTTMPDGFVGDEAIQGDEQEWLWR